MGPGYNSRSHAFNDPNVSSVDRNPHSLTDTVLGKDIDLACERLLCCDCKFLQFVLIAALTAVDCKLYSTGRLAAADIIMVCIHFFFFELIMNEFTEYIQFLSF